MKKILLSLSMLLAANVFSAELISTALQTIKIKRLVSPRSHIVKFGKAGIAFDSDTMRMSAAWEDGLTIRGLPFTRHHGPFPTLGGELLFYTNSGPGWSYTPYKSGLFKWFGKKPETSFSDPRSGDSPKLGPLPEKWAKFKGIYRHGDKVIFSYSVGKCNILDMPSIQQVDNIQVITRDIQISAKHKLQMVLAAGTVVIEGKKAFISANNGKQVAKCAITVSSGSLSELDGQLLLSLPSS